MNKIFQALESSRRELLDMGLRGNTLLHLRPGAKNLEIIDELTVETYRILVLEHKKMSFSPIPESILKDEEEREPDEDVDNTPKLPEILEEMYGDALHTDTKLQTKLNADKLEKR